MIAIIICVVAIATAVGVFLWMQSDSAAKAHEQVNLKVELTIPGYTEGQATPVPIKVLGNDVDGNVVDQVVLITPSQNAVPLTGGKYSVTSAGSPITTEGAIYTCPTDNYTVTVENGTAYVNDVESEVISFAFEQIPADQVTDEQVQAAYDWMVAAGMSDSVTQPYCDAVFTARKTAQSILAAKTEAEARAQQDAAHSSDYYMETDYYTDDIPNIWGGYVEYSESWNGSDYIVSIHMSGNPNLELASIHRYPIPGGSKDSLGTTDYPIAFSVDSDGYRYSIKAKPWAYLLKDGSEGYGISDDMRSQLIALSTGNIISASSVSSHTDQQLIDASTSYMKKTLGATFKLKPQDQGQGQ